MIPKRASLPKKTEFAPTNIKMLRQARRRQKDPADAPLRVPVDGSKHALRAVDYAISQAKLTAGRVHLLNVQTIPEQYGMVRSYLAQIRALATKHSRGVLKPASERLRRAGIAHDTHVAHGEVAPSIVRTARRLNCKCIIMGTIRAQ